MKNPFIAAMLAMAVLRATWAERFNAASSGKACRSRIPGKRNPAGSKLARRFAKRAGVDWDGGVIHTGELTKLNNERARWRRSGQQP